MTSVTATYLARHLPRTAPGFVSNVTIILALSMASGIPLAGSSLKYRVTVFVSQSRAEAGQAVPVRIAVARNGNSSREPVHAKLLMPSRGVESIALHPMPSQLGQYSADIVLPQNAPPGLYVIHAWTGSLEDPSGVGKASFLLGKIVGDFLIASALDETHPADDLKAYLDDFRKLGGNFLIAHNLITSDKTYFPCSVCKRSAGAAAGTDVVGLLLSEADKRGYAVLLSVSWDMTRDAPYDQRMSESEAIMDNLFRQYVKHPSFAGFYSFQEGSGTYYVPYIRHFCRHAKSLDAKLLVACAPYVDDPLLAGYLSALDDLDIIIWQSGVMGSYRADNRKTYPLRRVKDFCSLAAGAKQLQHKIALTHVELFGYLEQRLTADVFTTGYNNIYQQVLSAATISDTDGIVLFTYHYHIYNALKQHSQIRESRRAVVDGLTAFQLITSRISRDPNPLAFYFPYSDWVIERWSNSFLPALDAFRVLGIPVDVLPYAPPRQEAILPYYPIHMNGEALARLLRRRTVLVLPNVSGFQQTDSDLIKAFVEQGGAVIAFGPEIPMGRSYERRDLFGGEESETKMHTGIVVDEALGNRIKAGSRFEFEKTRIPSWTASAGRAIARFEDGSAAVIVTSFGKGKAVMIAPDAETSARYFPQLVRDAVDYVLGSAGVKRPVDILGTNERTDIAVEKIGEGFALAIVNHNAQDLEVTMRPTDFYPDGQGDWIDLVSGKEIFPLDRKSLKVLVPAGGFRAIEMEEP